MPGTFHYKGIRQQVAGSTPTPAVNRIVLLMEQNQMLFKLKEMEFVEKIADKIGEVSINGQSNIAEQLKTIFSK